MALTVGELVGYLRIDDTGWHRGLARARAALAEASRGSAGDFQDMADKVTTAGNKAAASLLQVALSVSKVAAAAAGLHGLITVVSQLSGVLGLLPAVGAAGAAALITLKLGMSGFGDAMKATDPEKFAENLGKLAPAARETAVAAKDLAPAWHSVQQSVQGALFAGVAQDVRALGSGYLPVLKTGLSGIASEFNTATHNTAGFLAQSQQVGTVSGIFGNLRGAIGNTSTVLQPLVSILLDLVAVGSEFLPDLSHGFGDSAKSAAEFVHEARESGKLHDWIASGLDTLRKLGEIFGNVAAIARAVFKGLDLGGAGLLDTLLRVTGSVRTFLESFEGQEALRSLGTVLSTVSGVVSSVLMTALQQLAPVVIALAPGFAQLATQVGSILTSALQTAGPLLTSLAGFLSDNADWLGPLAIALYAAAQAFQVVSAAVRVLNMVSSANPWVLIITATIALATLIVTHWDNIKQAVGAAWQWLSDTASAVWGWIERNIIDHITNAARWVGDRIQDVLNFFGWLGSLPGKAAEWFGSVARWAGDKLAEAVQFFRDLPGNILRALGDLGSLLVNAGRDIVRGLLRGLEDFAGKIWDWIKGIAGRIWDGITDFFDIFSPSKKMAWAGRMIGLGLANGLDAMNGKVVSAADQLAAAGMVTVPAPVIGAVPLPATARTPSPPPPVPVPVATGADRGPLVHIEHYHPPADATPGQVATDLDWLMRGGGR
jgi:hypothetical protein